MIFFKCCRRCSGDQVLEKDTWGTYLSCIQCGDVNYGGGGQALLDSSSRPGEGDQGEREPWLAELRLA